MIAHLSAREEDGAEWPLLWWQPGTGWRMVASTVLGGGIAARPWWLNAMVGLHYDRTDPAAHLREIATGLGLVGEGVGMLTAADVRHWCSADDGGVVTVATVGLGLPVWAAVPAEVAENETAESETAGTADPVGTVNLLVVVPVPLSDAALVNAVATATEAKVQALAEAGIAGTGTASDAVCVACPEPVAGEPVEVYGGSRSLWGARVARAVHAAVGQGTDGWVARHGHPQRGRVTPWSSGP